jgi:glycosyltransferase involved in cell wall biosynthesis
MGVRFSLVYPTRHRPEFMRRALDILETQRYDDFEVVVCDNYVDPALSCEAIAHDSSLPHLEYVRPPRPLGMVENWNHALQFASGDYVSYLTDKMFVLPDALSNVAKATDAAGGPEIVSWPSDAFNPASFTDYFGDGVYFSKGSDNRSGRYQPFSPAEELDRRGQGGVSRTEQSSSDYSRGKIVFGAYRRELIQRMVDRFGAAFHNISPDYTSMVLALAEARDAIHMDMSCVVSVNTDVSNGALVDNDDAAALGFLNSLVGGAEAILPNLLVPGLYASLNNFVAHDLLTLKRAFGLDFAFNTTNWLVYCHEDIYRPARHWSDPAVEAEQKRLLRTFIDSLGKASAADVKARLKARARAKAPKHELRVPFSRTARRAWQRLAASSSAAPEIAPEPEPTGPPDRIAAPSITAAVESFVAARS